MAASHTAAKTVCSCCAAWVCLAGPGRDVQQWAGGSPQTTGHSASRPAGPATEQQVNLQRDRTWAPGRGPTTSPGAGGISRFHANPRFCGRKSQHGAGQVATGQPSGPSFDVEVREEQGAPRAMCVTSLRISQTGSTHPHFVTVLAPTFCFSSQSLANSLAFQAGFVISLDRLNRGAKSPLKPGCKERKRFPVMWGFTTSGTDGLCRGLGITGLGVGPMHDTARRPGWDNESPAYVTVMSNQESLAPDKEPSLGCSGSSIGRHTRLGYRGRLRSFYGLGGWGGSGTFRAGREMLAGASFGGAGEAQLHPARGLGLIHRQWQG
ncbi:uncharacterized protein B0I36DRAFT_430990 [Microdochium trichocladiopsis]|uniref:Uncharacterized protein n=1 Tax=Microdochium trichocladiopsis TaxID=1682393 RepID=A0A9P8Y6Q0_9PEZI|nr:uncharacterized protein B0I36DRAFT_430990 [Microdochium trichocladiopsis]KAH7030713.1 hypothetical protein B0I36DRAFT_430990 [Microdochium trichocladiopsis]